MAEHDNEKARAQAARDALRRLGYESAPWLNFVACLAHLERIGEVEEGAHEGVVAPKFARWGNHILEREHSRLEESGNLFVPLILPPDLWRAAVALRIINRPHDVGVTADDEDGAFYLSEAAAVVLRELLRDKVFASMEARGFRPVAYAAFPAQQNRPSANQSLSESPLSRVGETASVGVSVPHDASSTEAPRPEPNGEEIAMTAQQSSWKFPDVLAEAEALLERLKRDWEPVRAAEAKASQEACWRPSIKFIAGLKQIEALERHVGTLSQAAAAERENAETEAHAAVLVEYAQRGAKRVPLKPHADIADARTRPASAPASGGLTTEASGALIVHRRR
jgi:hypothetical protein